MEIIERENAYKNVMEAYFRLSRTFFEKIIYCFFLKWKLLYPYQA